MSRRFRTELYAPPRHNLSLEDCYFYHSMTIPDVGFVRGEWEIKNALTSYLGGVDFKNKTVLEIGPASGYLSLRMKMAGADVTSYDVDENELVDNLLPPGERRRNYLEQYKVFIRKMNNSYWFCHEKFRLDPRMVFGNVYDIPEELGPFDISTCGCVLIHLRDPIRAIGNICSKTSDTLIITEATWCEKAIKKLGKFQNWLDAEQPMREFTSRGSVPIFIMEPASKHQFSWWLLPPAMVGQIVSIFGFETIRVVHHSQKYNGREVPFYTLVARRTSDGMSSLY